jgi:predicted dehydrogenase
MLKFLIVGFGSIGKRHFDNLQQIGGLEIVVLTRRDIEIPGFKVFHTLKDALSQGYDAVFITNESSYHIPMALIMAEKGYNLFIEKPLSHNLKDVDGLIRLANRKKLKVMIGCNMRFHPTVSLGRELVQQGKIGRIISAQITAGQYLPDWHAERDYRDSYSASKKKGGGVILDLIHELDYAVWYFGKASRVFAFCGKRSDLQIETEDTAEILLDFKNGVWCQVHLDYLRRIPVRSFSLIGTEGVVEGDIINNNIRVFDNGGKKEEISAAGTDYNANSTYIAELKQFIDYINGTISQPLTGLADGARVLKIAVAAKESGRTGKTVRL